MSLHYYISSPSFRGHIDPGQVADPDDVISKVFNERSADKVVTHQMQFKAKTGEELVADAESFSNSYTVSR